MEGRPRVHEDGGPTAGFAHEFNNLLTVITGYTGLALARVGDTDPQLRADLEAIATAADQATALMQTLVTAGQQAAAAGSAPGGEQERILLVDDDPRVRELVLTILRRGGYDVDEADGPEKALDLLSAGRAYDLLLTDVVMPKMDGTELAERVDGLQPGIKVLYISGYTGAVPIEAASNAPGRAFVQKPFSGQTLSETVRALLDTDICPAVA